MSEEILKALMQLFAIIAKQDNGSSDSQRKFVEAFLISQLSSDKVQEYLLLYDRFLNEGEVAEGPSSEAIKATGELGKKKNLTSVRDSVRTLSICRKVNKTLTQKQKAVVLIRLWELIKVDNIFTPNRIEIVNTIANVFNITTNEAKLVENFIVNEDPYTLDSAEMLVIDDKHIVTIEYINSLNHFQSEGLNGYINIVRINSVNLYFLKFRGTSEVYLNGLPLNNINIYLLAPGSTLRLPRGTIYYSDVVNYFAREGSTVSLSFITENLEFKFPNGNIALRNINIAEKAGTLIALMGASGAGKTTLLNVLSGIEKPSVGTVKINGINCHVEKEKVEGIVGYIAQDDLLFEDLTVYQNLFYNAKLCFKDLPDAELVDRVMKTLESLGLAQIKDIKVGSPLNKSISGGQRKRLNIALELIREPSVLFVDEPTSGLSSRDSENVMDLLKELTQKGKLIFVVIHQPSSDIYKMFDKLFLLDTGGYPIYYGNPVEGVMYFKKAAHQANSDVGECHICGSVNPELLFNIIEAKEVDEYGSYTPKRKLSPTQWSKIYLENKVDSKIEEVTTPPPKTSNIPSKTKQYITFIKRDVLSKLSNKQYLLINLLEAPVLAFILAFIIRYYHHPNSDVYVFRENENLPAYIFMSIIVALFIGLTLSAEEIFKDQKILKRERFLNLSRASYLISKVSILFFVSAIQTLLFAFIGNYIIGLKDMTMPFWMMLFSVSCFANMLGLNISSSFNSAVTIYIIIPLLIIPQMILGGAMFSYDKLNKMIGGGTKVPTIADVMVSRWAYEGLTVNQFMNNNYEKAFYDYDKKISQANFKVVYWIPELVKITEDCKRNIDLKGDSLAGVVTLDLNLLQNTIKKELVTNKNVAFNHVNQLTKNSFTKSLGDSTIRFLNRLNEYYTVAFNDVDNEKEMFASSLQETREAKAKFDKIKNNYANKYLEEVIKKTYSNPQIIRENNELVQVIDPVFMDVTADFFSVKAPFNAPQKNLLGKPISTFSFNLIVIWLMSVILFMTLYFDVLKRMIS